MNHPHEYRRVLFVVRYVLPSMLTVVGLALIVIYPSGAGFHGGLGIIGAGLAAFLFAFLAKVSMTGDTQQRKDDEARRYFELHGRWPDDE